MDYEKAIEALQFEGGIEITGNPRKAAEFFDGLDVAISALQELQLYKDGKLCLIPESVYSKQCDELDTYKQLGTLEEVREAVEFRKARKPILPKILYKKFGREEEITAIYCKTCGNYITNFTEAEMLNFCKTCGQAIDWSEEDD